MIRMETVWDRTVEVLRGRAGVLTRLAALYLFLPAVASGALRLFAPASPALQAVAGLVGLASGVLVLVAVLAISAVASDPAVDAAAAQRAGFGRLGPALAAVAVILALVMIAFLPAVALMVAAGATANATTGQLDMAQADGAMVGWGLLALVVAGIAALWFSARLAALFPVIVNERRGLGAIARSFRLTRGSALKLIGVTLLYFIVLGIVLGAIASVTGLAARLLLGADAAVTVRFVVAIVTDIVTAGATVLQTVFYTRFYVLAREREEPALAA